MKIDDVEKAYKTCLKLDILHLGSLNDTDFLSNTTGFIVFFDVPHCEYYEFGKISIFRRKYVHSWNDEQIIHIFTTKNASDGVTPFTTPAPSGPREITHVA